MSYLDLLLIPTYHRYTLLVPISRARVKGGHSAGDREDNKDLTVRGHQIIT